MDLEKIQLCEADETAALEFLRRAVPVICNAGIVPATLSLLDSMNAHPNAYGLADRAGMVALAAEWAGSYQSPGVGVGRSPATVRELVIAALEADDAGNYDFGFRTYAVDETEHWNLAGTPLDGVPMYGLYLIREGEQTFCCSLTPSSWAVNLENVACYPDQEGLPKVNGYGQTDVEAYMDARDVAYEGLDDTYIGYMGDRAELDRREAERGDVSERFSFDESALTVDLSKLSEHAGSPADPYARDAFADMATLAAAFYKIAAETAWEDAEEYCRGNAVHPRALLLA